MSTTDFLSNGLSSEEAARRLEQYGPNRLPDAKSAGAVVLFLRQFKSPFIYLLILAAGVSFSVSQIPSGVFIIIVLLINAGIGTFQEYAAEKASTALKQLVHGSARVRRDGVLRTVDAADVVPGDQIHLASGDKVAADIRLERVNGLTVDESMLTGESIAVEKTSTRNQQDASLPVAYESDRLARCYAGTVVTYGRAIGVVEATGTHTALGSIADTVGEERVSEPPLILRIRSFTFQIALGIAVAIAALVLLMVAIGSYETKAIILMTIGLAVSVIPEGLPASVTIALAIGMDRMAKANVIIRSLVAVEALGSCTFICSDKTGTLTVNDLTVKKIIMPGGAHFDVTGEGVGPGEVITEEQDERLRDLCRTGIYANESNLDYAGGNWAGSGDIVDVAFLVLAKKLGLSLSEVRELEEEIENVPYESERAMSGSLTRSENGCWLHVKGSPEKIVDMSTHMLTRDGRLPIDREVIQGEFTALAEQGYRVIALARRESSHVAGAEDLMSEMTLLGLVGMIDPVRPEARAAVQRCQNGGIGVAMITGDHPATAHAIACEIGILQGADKVVTGQQLRNAEAKGQNELDALVLSTRVFARVEPLQKQEIVDTLIRAGHFVAVTGDGVNDAPAMRRAHVGVAMGRRGTDVAKEAADLIITDDRFASIVEGIEQGRIVYNNIRKVIALLSATGFSALVLFFLAVFAGLPMPMIAVQLLWLNLIANGVQDVALAFEPGEGDELDFPPRRPKEPILERHIIEHVLVIGGAMGALAFLTQYGLQVAGIDEAESRNLVLMLMVLFGNIHALSSRSERRSLFRTPLSTNKFLLAAVPLSQLMHIGATYTPWLSDVLDLRPVTLIEWLSLFGVAMVLLAIEEIHKMSIRYRQTRARTK